MAAFTKWNGQTLVFQPIAPAFEFFDPAVIAVESKQVVPYSYEYQGIVDDPEFQRKTREFAEQMVARWWADARPFWWTW